MDIVGKLSDIRNSIEEIAARAGRNPANIKLVAVSKTMPISTIHEAYLSGQRVFGENRIQEYKEKREQLPEDCEWHLVGRVQTNKVKYLDSRLTLIHSLDRFELLAKLDEQGRKVDHIFSALIQVNVAEDAAKAGLNVNEVKDFLAAAGDFPHVRIQGLMTIGALEATREETRGSFRRLRELREEYKDIPWPGVELAHLSMGMSGDFDLAIEEGATIIRIGRQIFGAR